MANTIVSVNLSYNKLATLVSAVCKTGVRKQEIELDIVKYPMLSLLYARSVLRQRWYEAEPYLIQSLIKHSNDYFRLVREAMAYAEQFIDGRWDKIEPCILRSHHAIYQYALRHIKGRWARGEQFLVNSPYWSYFYALNVIKGRWRRAEPYILRDSESAYLYSYNVFKRRWPAAEKILASDVSVWSVWYAENVIQDRWPEIEPQILLYHQNTSIWQTYGTLLLKIAVRDHNPLILVDLANRGYAKRLKNLIKCWSTSQEYPYSLRKKPGTVEYYTPPADFPHW